MDNPKVGDFELIDHGIYGCQYFPGCGTEFTDFDNVVTGIGDNPAEALDDLLEMVSQSGWDTEGLEERIKADAGPLVDWSTPSVMQEAEEQWESERESDDQEMPDDCMDGNELYYHLSLRWNPAPAEVSA